MISLEQAVVARLESHGEKFEILVEPHLAARIRQGENINIEDAVAALNVFGNSSKATRASEESLEKVFHTTDFATVAKKIIEKGEIHLTADQRREMTEEKRRKVINFIARNAVNPRPATRTRQRGLRWRWKRPGSISIPSSMSKNR